MVRNLQTLSLNQVKRNAEARGLRVTLANTTGYAYNSLPRYKKNMRLVERQGPFALVKPIIVTIKNMSRIISRIIDLEFLYAPKMKQIIREYNRRVNVKNKYKYGYQDFVLNNRLVDSDMFEKKVTKDITLYVVYTVFNPRGTFRRRQTVTRTQARELRDYTGGNT